MNEALLNCSCISMSVSSRDVVARGVTLKLTVAVAYTWGIDKGRPMPLFKASALGIRLSSLDILAERTGAILEKDHYSLHR